MFSPDSIQSLLTDAEIRGAVVDVDPIPSRDYVSVARVAVEGRDRPLILKCAAEETGLPRVRTDLATTRFVARETDLPVPTVLGFDVSDDAPVPYFLATECPGTLVHRYDPPIRENRALLREIGARLGELHASFSFDEPGEIVGSETGELVVRPWPSHAALRLHREISGERLLRGPLGDLVADALAFLERERDAVTPRERPVLLHHDYTTENVFARDDRVSGIIDWEEAAAGDPVSDLVGLEWELFGPDPTEPQQAVRAALYEGYADQYPLPPDFERRASWHRLVTTLGVITMFRSTDWDAVGRQRRTVAAEIEAGLRRAIESR